MSTKITYTNEHNDIARKAAKNGKYNHLILSVDFNVAEDNMTYTSMVIEGGFIMVLTTTVDEYGDQFNIVAYRVVDDVDGNQPKRKSIVSRDSGPTSMLAKAVYETIDKLDKMS